ncbi:transposase [Paraphaeosphaeria sporulosa]
MLHRDALQAARIKELEEQLDAVTKRKSRKRKRIQQGGTMEYGPTADQVAAGPSTASRSSKKARGGSASEGGPSTQRRCGNCGGSGHNARTCQEAEESSFESDITLSWLFSDSVDSDSDESES